MTFWTFELFLRPYTTSFFDRAPALAAAADAILDASDRDLVHLILRISVSLQLELDLEMINHLCRNSSRKKNSANTFAYMLNLQN